MLIGAVAASVPAARAQSVLPNGGRVTAGSATIGPPAGNTLSITQTSPRAVIDWNGFSIGQPNTVNFAQPNSSAAVLNRVTGSTPSTIAGQLNANGQVYLVNPNGIAITKSGAVNVGGGFVASTLGIANRDFMNGNLAFTGNGGSASVSNAGTINTGNGGYAALLGGTAANSGTINVPLGKVGMGSGERATLDVNGEGFLQVAAPTSAKTAQGQSLIDNSGAINAPGGVVQLKAATVATAIRDAVNMSGVVSANSVSGHSGAITLGGGPGGNVNVSGTLDVSAPVASGVRGGSVTVSGSQVTLGAKSLIDARGARGGSVLVGVTAPGGVGKSKTTTIAPGAQILANGDPAQPLNGGSIETSGDTLTFGGATIQAGNGGKWLLDPNDLIIDSAEAASINASLANANTFVGALSANDLYIEAALQWNTSSVLNLQATNNTFVDAPITLNANGTLQLPAGNNIFVNAPITLTSNGLATLTSNIGGANSAATITVNDLISVTANGRLDFETPGNTAGPIFTMGQGSAQFTKTAGQTLTINGQAYTLLFTMADVQTISAAPDVPYALAGPIANGGVFATEPVSSLTSNGKLNGLGNTIANLSITSPDMLVGLIGSNRGEVSNLGLVNESVNATTNNSAGGVVGENYGTLNNVYVIGTITNNGSADVGGLVGFNAGSITTSYAAGTLSGSYFAGGGLVGYNDGTIADSYAVVSISTADNASVGGLVGVNSSFITNTYATGTINAPQAVVGGLIGQSFAGIVSAGYWNVTTEPGTNGIGIGSGDVTPLTTAQLAGGLPSGFSVAVWGNVRGQTTPYLISNPGPVYLGTDGSTTPTQYTLLFTPTQLQGINNNLTGAFAMATDIDLTNVANFTPIGQATPFTGTFNGLGNSILNLKINDMTDISVGLFARVDTGGAVSNVALVGGGVSGTQTGVNVGALAGTNSGSLFNVGATTNVSGGPASKVGGLVGLNSAGTISNSWASGNVITGTAGVAGGLVGNNTFQAAIQNSYATGSVSNNGATAVGGLAGENLMFATITSSYATGPATGTEAAGGLVGINGSGASISTSYWDTTTGLQSGVGSNTASIDNASGGLSTDALATALPAGFGAAVWGNVNNQTTPYLLANPGPVYAANDPTGALYTLIFTAGQLQALSATTTDVRNYALANNLNLAGVSFTPIGSFNTNPFQGAFNGLGNVIQNLTINDTTHTAVGLFGDIFGAYIQNIGLVGGSITASANGVQVGALVGAMNTNSIVINAYSTASVTAQNNDSPYVGGLVGQNAGAIRNSYSTGRVTTTSDVTNALIGGLVGSNAGGIVNASYATGPVSASGSMTAAAGGLIGDNAGLVQNSYATGMVTVASGNGFAGGLIGSNEGIVNYAYATGAVSGTGTTSQVGGLVGNNSNGTIEWAYAAGAVSGPIGSTGAVVGTNNGTGAQLSDIYYNQDRAGTFTDPMTMMPTPWPSIGANNGPEVSITALSDTTQGLASPFQAASYQAFAFGNQPNNSGTWVMVNLDGSIATNGDTALAGALPMLSTEYATTIQSAHQLQLMALAPNANYTLAADIDASATGSSTSLTTGADVWGQHGFVPVQGYGGTFDGANHTIANLNINTSLQYVGLFGQVLGAVENVGLLGGSITNGLIINNGTSTGSIAAYLGSNATISQVYSSAAVTGGDVTGGLVGFTNPQSLVVDSYATGAVSAPGFGGGLIGVLYGTASRVYSTGVVTGAGSLGGLIGVVGIDKSNKNIGVVNFGYWDTDTSGETVSALGTPMTTVALQAALPSGFTTPPWNIIATKTYPFLSGQFDGGTPQVISGTVYAGATTASTTARAGVAVAAVDDGVSLAVKGGGTTGANGYYYLLLAPGSIGTGDNVVVYTTGTVSGLAFLDQLAASSAYPNTSIFGGTLNYVTTGFSFSQVRNDANTAKIADSGNSTITAIFNSASNLSVNAASPGGFNVDSELTVGNGTGTFTLNNTLGPISEPNGSIAARTVTGSSVGGVTLTSAANTVSNFGAWTDTENQGISFTNHGSLTTIGTLSSPGGTITLTTTNGGDLTLGTLLAAGKVTLTSAGTVSQAAGTTIGGQVLTGSSVGGATLTNGGNHVGTFSFSDTGAGSTGVKYVNAGALNVVSVTSVSGPIALTTTGSGGDMQLFDNLTAHNNSISLTSSGGILQSGGVIDPTTLAINSNASVTMTDNNMVDVLTATITNFAASLTFTNAVPPSGTLTIGDGTTGITTANGNVTVSTSIGALALQNQISAGSGTVTLVSATNFSTNAGAGTIAAGNWLVYSTNPAKDDDTGLIPAFIQYNAPFGTALAAAGNGLLYSVAPAITITGVSKTYDGTTALPAAIGQYTTSGTINGDSVTGLSFAGGGGYEDKNVNTGIKIDVAGGAVTATHAGGIPVFGYALTALAADPIGTITTASLTLTASGGVTKTYDGTTGATGVSTLTAGTVFAGDTLTGLGQAFTSKDVNGAGGSTLKPTFTLSDGNSGNNYAVTLITAPGTINPAPLTVSAVTDTKTYDGTSASTATPVVSSGTVFASDTLPTLTQSFSLPNAGTQAIGVTPFAVGDGNAGKDYSVTLIPTVGTINQAPLTFTGTKTYDGSSVFDTGTLAAAGAAKGETITINTGTGFAASANAATYGGSLIGGLSISVTGGNALASNYSLPASGALTINPAPLTIAGNKNYDGSPTFNAATLSATGAQNSEFVTVTAGTGQASDLNAGTYAASPLAGLAIQVIGGNGLASNYSLPLTGTLTIAKAPITVSIIGNPTKTYDGTTGIALAGANYTVSGFAPGEGAMFTPVPAGNYITKNAGTDLITAGLGSGNFALNAGTLASNYTLPSAAVGFGTISPVGLAITAVTASKTYDGTTAASGTPTYQVATLGAANTLIAGDSFAALGDAFVSKNVAGPNGSVVTPVFAISDGNGGKNYAVTLNNVTGTISPATLSISATSDTKTYDGTVSSSAKPTYSVAGLPLNTLFPGDSFASLTQAFTSKDVMGPGNSVLMPAVHVLNDGNGGGNYVLLPLGSAPGTINPATVTAAIVGAPTKIYDATAAATLSAANYALTGFVPGEGASVTQTVATYAGPDAGAKLAITANLSAGDFTAKAGTSFSNYTLPTVASGSGTITPAPVTATIIGNPTKVYDGITAAILDPTNFSLTGFVAGQGAGVTQTVGTYASANTGGTIGLSATLSPGDFAAAPGTLLSNYALPQTASGTGAITPATLTYTANPASRIYGGVNPAFSGTVSGFVHDETLATATTGNAAFTSTANALSDVGNYAINGAGLTAKNGNYVFVQAAGNATALAITPATLSYVANATTRTYGSPDPVLTGTVTGFVNGQTQETATTGALNFASTTTGATVVGSYGITGSGLTAKNGDYVFLQAPGNGTALTIAPAPLTVIAIDQSKTYGQSLALGTTGFATSGLFNSDTVSGVSLTSSGAAARAVVAGSPYVIVPSLAVGTGLGNYTITYANGKLTVLPAPLTVVLAGTAGKVYDSTTAANNLTPANYALVGVVPGDTVSLSAPSSGVYGSASAGTGIAITVSGLSIGGASSGNYLLAGNTASGNIGTITPAPLTVAANNASRDFGQPNPAFGFVLTTGTLFNGDTITGSPATAATTVSAAGTYAITQGSVTASANYQINFVNGVLTVLPTSSGMTNAVEAALPAVAVLTTLANTNLDAAGTSFTIVPAGDIGQVAAPGQRKVQTPQDVALASIASFRAAACSASNATPALFVVLPSATGKKIGGVVVNDGAGEEVLDQAFAAAAVSDGELSSCRVSKSEIDTTFKKAVSARPMLPHHFTLQLTGGGDRLDPDSQKLYRELMADIAQRRAYQIEIIGYAPSSDRQRALVRAAAIRALLTKDLIKADKISLTARAKFDALMPSGDQATAASPDRVVEIWVR